MKVLPVSAVAFFCDSYRREEGNRSSMIGIEGNCLRVEEYPLHIPRLEVFVLGRFDLKSTPDTFDFSVILGDEVLVSHPADAAFLSDLASRAEAAGLSAARLQTSVEIVGLQISEDCDLFAVAAIDGEKFQIGHLQIREIRVAKDAA